jgi:hypothetical protein
LAFTIDLLLYLMTQVPEYLLRGSPQSRVGTSATALLWVALGIGQVWLLAVRGQTVGKILLKIAIVDRGTNLPPGFLRAAVIRQGPQQVLTVIRPTGDSGCDGQRRGSKSLEDLNRWLRAGRCVTS